MKEHDYWLGGKCAAGLMTDESSECYLPVRTGI